MHVLLVEDLGHFPRDNQFTTVQIPSGALLSIEQPQLSTLESTGHFLESCRNIQSKL